MYPVIRTLKEIILNRRRPALGPMEAHVSWHRCWPQDIDVYLEMNNGRILTIMDLGRTGLGIRTGLVAALQRNGWGLTIPADAFADHGGGICALSQTDQALHTVPHGQQMHRLG
jgi:hypothetical protein